MIKSVVVIVVVVNKKLLEKILSLLGVFFCKKKKLRLQLHNIISNCRSRKGLRKVCPNILARRGLGRWT
jgi:hypothetical protein